MSQQRVFIAISGNIGTGKTTLTQLLADRFRWEPRFEAVEDNPYLSDFYSDMSRWSFPLQIFFLNHRLNVHKNISGGTVSAIQDRSIYEDANIFARNLYEQGHMEERDYVNYLSLYKSVCGELQPPSLMIYLRKDVDILKDRISKRGRDYEKSISDEYLSNLNLFYDEWMEGYSIGPKLIVQSNDRDFLYNKTDFNWLADEILAAIDQKDLFDYGSLPSNIKQLTTPLKK